MTECSVANSVDYTSSAQCSSGVGSHEQSPFIAKKSGRPTFENTVIIFDWDDTLLASSWLVSQGFRLDSNIPTEAVYQLKSLENAVVRLLSKAFMFGEVLFVTNGEKGWVEMSSQKFLPRVYELLPRIKIVSARSTYQDLYPDCPESWKVEAFRSTFAECFENRMEVETKFNSSFRNLISFGDSHHERNALKKVTSDMKNTYSKSIKFVEQPTLEQLQRQLKIINGNLEYVCTHDDNLDLMLVVEMLCES